MENQLKTITLASLVKNGTVTNISKLRKNTNGYRYVTLMQGSKSNNVYFGGKTSEFLENHFNEGDKIFTILKNANIIQTKNESGEIRFKLALSESSDYASTAELMEVFGVKEETTDFDLELFEKEFTSKTAILTP